MSKSFAEKIEEWLNNFGDNTLNAKAGSAFSPPPPRKQASDAVQEHAEPTAASEEAAEQAGHGHLVTPLDFETKIEADPGYSQAAVDFMDLRRGTYRALCGAALGLQLWPASVMLNILSTVASRRGFNGSAMRGAAIDSVRWLPGFALVPALHYYLEWPLRQFVWKKEPKLHTRCKDPTEWIHFRVAHLVAGGVSGFAIGLPALGLGHFSIFMMAFFGLPVAALMLPTIEAIDLRQLTEGGIDRARQEFELMQLNPQFPLQGPTNE